jgi:hypothetical protein
MPLLDLFSILPFPPVELLVCKKIHQILIEPRVVLFDGYQILAIIGIHPCAPLLLSMHRIGTQDSAFHQNRMRAVLLRH